MSSWDELAAAIIGTCSVRDSSDGWIQVSYSWDDGRQQIVNVTAIEFNGEPLALLTSPIVGFTEQNAVWMLSNVDVPLRATDDGMISMAHPIHLKGMSTADCLSVISTVAAVADEIENSVTGGHDAYIPLRGEEVAADPETGQSNQAVITAGQWIVGRDISPGLYRYAGYVARLDNQMGIINNDSARSGLGLVLVSPHDSYLEVSGEAIRIEDMPVYDVLANAPRDGTYLVGVDLPVGRYRVHGEGRSAYYATYDRNLQRISNDLNNGSLILDLRANVFAVEFNGRLEPLGT